jgi:anaerobic magnesium-protoporphyrin IX monomethyl ester cyclase
VNSPLYENTHLSNNEDYLPPLGLGLLYTSLKGKFNVDFIDCLALDWTTDELIGYINNHYYDFICINIFTTNFLQVKKVVESTYYQTHWIVGGISTKSLYSEIFKWQTASDISIVYGDGELIISDIIANTVKQSPVFGNTKDKRFYKVDYNSVYYNTNISCEIIDRSIFSAEPEINIFGEKEVCIYTSRGCPYNCAYCMAAYLKNKELGLPRQKSTESIIAELKTISELYPEAMAIRIVDDLFLCKEQNFKDACTIFGNYNFKWRAMCHIWSIHLLEDNLALNNLYGSGCRELFIGIESGSPRILTEIHKTASIDIIKESVTRILNSGISVKGYFICGFPNETMQDLELTYGLAKQLSDYAKTRGLHFRNSTFQFRPYYGTELYDKIITEKNIKYNSLLYRTRISKNINFHIRNKSFNFDSGNYSLVKDDDLHQYIKKMNDLNA